MRARTPNFKPNWNKPPTEPMPNALAVDRADGRSGTNPPIVEPIETPSQMAPKGRDGGTSRMPLILAETDWPNGWARSRQSKTNSWRR
jgi:hypothetical protein